MRILRANTQSRPKIVEEHLTGLNLLNQSYEQIAAHVEDLELGYGSGLKRSLIKLGWECIDIYHDVRLVQTVWAVESGQQFDIENWWRDIFFAQIRHFRPDVVFLQGTEFPGGAEYWLAEKDSLDPVPLLIGHYGHTQDVSPLDHAFLGFPCLVNSARKSGKSASLLYHAFDAEVLKKLDANPIKAYPLTFVGTSGIKINSHYDRYSFLQELGQLIPISFWLDDFDTLFGLTQGEQNSSEVVTGLLDRFHRVARDPIRIAHKLLLSIKRFLPQQELTLLPRELCRKGVYGLDLHRVVQQSLMTLQYHSTAMKGEVGALRLFHAPGVSTCLVTDHGSNLEDLFEVDHEIVSYRNVHEASEKISFLLENPEKALQIAIAGQKRILRDHTHHHRALQIIEVLKSLA
jgi:hypothetical protein